LPSDAGGTAIYPSIEGAKLTVSSATSGIRIAIGLLWKTTAPASAD
jgi:hypothetical protein